MAGKKIILLTNHKRLHKALSQSIKKKGLQYENSISALCDIDHIFKLIKITKNTLFIRDAYSDFIKKNNGTPLCIVIDYKIDLGLPLNLDPDKMKLVRTFLISSVILGNMTNLHYNKTNIIFISSPDNHKQLEGFKADPSSLFKLIMTTQPQLNQLLQKFVDKPEEAKRLFYINYLFIDSRNDVFPAVERLENIIDKLLVRKQSMLNEEKAKGQTGLLSGTFEPAKVLFKLSDARLYLESKIYNIENNHKFDKYKENIIYIIGHYVHSNVNEVNQKLKSFILDGLPKLKKITADTEINISLNSHSIIDGGITPALNILLSTTLKDYKNIRLITSPVNFSKMEKSPGFISLRNYIFKRL